MLVAEVPEAVIARILQDGTVAYDVIHSVTVAEDASIILAGHTRGDFTGSNTNVTKAMVAVELDRDGNEIWRWQVRRDGIDLLLCFVEYSVFSARPDDVPLTAVV